MYRIDNIGFGGLKVCQDEGFRYGIDSVILADFVNGICPGAGSVVDLGTGNGIIPFVLSHKNRKCRITGVELQKESFDLACRGLEINGLESRVSFMNSDIKDIDRTDFSGKTDTVVSNPPYVVRGGGIVNPGSRRHIARQETTASLDDFVGKAAELLDRRGDFFMVHRPSRLADIIASCRSHRLEPKDMRLVVPFRGRAPNILLIHCVLGGGTELRIMPQLEVRDGSGGYSDEVERIYERACK